MWCSQRKTYYSKILSIPAFDGPDFQLLHIDIAMLISIHMNSQKMNYFYPKMGVYSSRPPDLRGANTGHYKSEGYKLEFIRF